jgi:MoxR-like ATPase
MNHEGSLQTLLKKGEATLNRHLLGKPQVVQLALVGLLAEGHLLIEDIPGVGKTTLAKSLAALFDLKVRRLQFTSDLLPADVLGISLYRQKEERFVFQSGPIFANILLADEINRANPKTQSALLEAMGERQVSLDGRHLPLPRPHFVIATQNPVEHRGTFPLPLAQLDRFHLCLPIGYPSETEEMRIISTMDGYHWTPPQALFSKDALIAMQEEVRAIHVDPEIVSYIYRLVRFTREHPELSLGISPRGGQTLFRCAQAMAYVQQRTFCIPDDVTAVCPYVFAHRLQKQGELRTFVQQKSSGSTFFHGLFQAVPGAL